MSGVYSPGSPLPGEGNALSRLHSAILTTVIRESNFALPVHISGYAIANAILSLIISCGFFSLIQYHQFQKTEQRPMQILMAASNFESKHQNRNKQKQRIISMYMVIEYIILRSPSLRLLKEPTYQTVAGRCLLAYLAAKTWNNTVLRKPHGRQKLSKDFNVR